MNALAVAALLAVVWFREPDTVAVLPPPICPTPLNLPELPEHLEAELDSMSVELLEFFVTRDQLQTARRETLQRLCRLNEN